MSKYLYFRSDATLANDDDNANGSNVYPLSSFKGMESSSDTTFTMYFEPKVNSFGDGSAANADNLSDTVVITITTANNQRAVMEELTRHFAKSKDSFIVVADDHAGEYLASDIASVGNFTVQAAQA